MRTQAGVSRHPWHGVLGTMLQQSPRAVSAGVIVEDVV
jgi:hypothetical protein